MRLHHCLIFWSFRFQATKSYGSYGDYRSLKGLTFLAYAAYWGINARQFVGPQNHETYWKMKVFNPKYMGYTPLKMRETWVPMDANGSFFTSHPIFPCAEWHPGTAMEQLQDFVLHGSIPGPKNTWDLMRYRCWKKSGVHQLRVVVYLIIHRGLLIYCIPPRWCRISSTNSMTWLAF